MKQKIIELMNMNFRWESIDGCNYWLCDGRIIACERPSVIDIYFDIDEKASMKNYKIITTYTSKRINYSHFDEFEKRLNTFVGNVKKIKKMIRQSMIEEL